MTTTLVVGAPQRAAKVVGIAYLFAMAVSIVAEMFIGSRLIAGNDAAATAQNIVAHEQLFRLGILCSLLVVVSDVSLITALYVILKRVNEPLALWATLLRLVGATLYATATLNYIDVVRLARGESFLQAIAMNQLQAMARLSITSYSAGLGVSFIYLGIGSTVFAYLWIKSRYVPKALGVLGAVASALLAAGALLFIVSPRLWAIVFPAYMAPLFFFEVGMGLWLLSKGLREV